MIRSPLAQHIVLSPNIEPRRGRRAVDMLILHYTGMASAAAACDQLCSLQSGVSCHYLVDTDGSITQMVGEDMRAWHAGASHWKGETDTNSRSIGIEIQNPGHGRGYPEFPEMQMAAVAGLCLDILSRHDVPPQHVLAHSDVAPGRKIDPGEKFPWDWLWRQGVGHWVEPAPANPGQLDAQEIARLQMLLAGYGYGLTVTGELDDQTRKVTDAFQRHFHQSSVTGIPDRSVLATLERLAG